MSKIYEKEIVHYMHFNKLWYYWIDEYERKKYWRKLEGNYDDLILLTEDIITERQCKIILQTLFQNYRIMKAYPYHYSPRYGSGGSRMGKCTIDRRGMLKDKIKFREKLKSFVE